MKERLIFWCRPVKTRQVRYCKRFYFEKVEILLPLIYMYHCVAWYNDTCNDTMIHAMIQWYIQKATQWYMYLLPFTIQIHVSLCCFYFVPYCCQYWEKKMTLQDHGAQGSDAASSPQYLHPWFSLLLHQWGSSSTVSMIVLKYICSMWCW